jgi:hypothetical protein
MALITPKVSTDPGRLIYFFTLNVSSNPGWKPTKIICPRICRDGIFPAYPKVHTNSAFGFLSKKLVILKTTINIHFYNF